MLTWICQWEPWILLALMPVFLFPTPESSILLIIFPLLWTCHFLTSRHFVPATPLDWPILLLMNALLLNLFITPNIIQSLPKLASLIFGICLYYSLVRWTTTETRRRALLISLSATSILLVFLTFLMQWKVGLKMPALQPAYELIKQIPRPLSLPGAEGGVNTNEIGGVLVIFIPLNAMLVLDEIISHSKSWPRIALYLLAFISTFTTTILSQSRSAILGALVGLLSLPAWRGWWGRILLAMVLLTLIGLASTGQLEPFLQSTGLVPVMSEPSLLSGRLLIWKRALYFWGQAPLTGIGLNQFRLVMPTFWPMSSPLAIDDLGHVHNQFLQVAVEMGLPGLVAYISIWGGVFRRVINALKRKDCPHSMRITLGTASGFLAFLTYGVFDAVALGARAGFPFWLFLATAVIFTSRTQRVPTTSD